MNRTVRRILMVVVVLCGVFVSGYLARAAAQRPADAPPTPGAEAEPSLEALAPAPPQPPAPGSPAPRLVALETTHDFGMLAQGATADHVFQVRNDGSATAHVTAVRSSCGCTATMVDRDEIPPGETAQVKATFRAGNFRGRFHKTIRIMSDDPGGPTVVSIIGMVKPRVQVDPEMVLFGKVRLGESVTRRVVLIPSQPGDRLKPDISRATGGALEITSAEPLEDGRWVLEITARPENRRDVLSPSLLLPTGLPESPSAVVRIAGEVEVP